MSTNESEDFNMTDPSASESEELFDDAILDNVAHNQHVTKRRKLNNSHDDPLHGSGDGIDYAEDAEFGLIQLEVRELLTEASLPRDLAEYYSETAHRLASILQSLPESDIDPTPVIPLLETFQFPYTTKIMKFKHPTRCSIVGSMAYNSCQKSSDHLDMAIEIPRQCLDQKDQLNHKYHAKKSLYLSHIAMQLAGQQNVTKGSKKKKKTTFPDAIRALPSIMNGLEILNISWEFLSGNPRMPILYITLQHHENTKKDSSDQKKIKQQEHFVKNYNALTIRLLPALSANAFPLNKLAPDRNNLRTACVAGGTRDAAGTQAKPTGNTKQDTGDHQGDVQLLPTPLYNASIVQDMLYMHHATMLQGINKIVPHFRDAVLLLKEWLMQHCLGHGADGFSPFLLTMFLAHLIQSNRIATHMSAMHMFRSTLITLADGKAFSVASPMAMIRRDIGSSSAALSPSTPTLKVWKHAGYAALFIDPSGWVNLAGMLSKAALHQTKQCAAKCAALLAKSQGPETFDAVFLSKSSLAGAYDSWYRIYLHQHPSKSTTKEKITISEDLSNSTETDDSMDQRMMVSQDCPSWLSVDAQVAAIAEKALNTRATLVRVFHRKAAACDSTSPVPRLKPERAYVTLALRLDPTISLRTIDIGPAADSGRPAAEFRAFWGDKSELRRFQDGKISEAVLWMAKSSARHRIVDEVLQYALHRHAGDIVSQPPNRWKNGTTSSAGVRIDVKGTSALFDPVLARKKVDPDAEISAVQLCDAALTRLTKQLRALDGITLNIVGVQSLSAVSRHAAAFPPLPHPLAGASRVADPTNHEKYSSLSLPRCLPALELLCQLEGSGRWPDAPAAFMKMKAAVGVQIANALRSNFGMNAQAAEEYVDVFMDGFAFRLRLYTERDDDVQHAMLAMGLSGLGTPRVPLDQDVKLRVWHQGLISAVAAANMCYEPTVRLAKRWIASQCLSNHFREETVELLVALAFSDGLHASAPPPGTRISGFLRFLTLLGTTPWHAQALCGDLIPGDAMTRKRNAAGRAHAAQRAEGTAPALFISGPKDEECVGWTIDRPSRPMLYRAVIIAQRAAAHLEGLLVGHDSTDQGNGDSERDTSNEELSSALSGIFEHDESQYDALIRLRSDALPNWSITLPCKGTVADEYKKATTSDGNSNRNAHVGWQVYRPELSQEEERRCRAVLKGIPGSVVQHRGTSAVQKELLVGFDPVPHYVDLLERFLGDAVIVCADYLGGRSIGLKVKGSYATPGALHPETAHLMRPAIDPGEELAVCIDMEAVVRGASLLGLGLIEKIEYKNE